MRLVAFCDDDPLQLRDAAQAVQAHAEAFGLELEIATYQDVDSLLDTLASPGADGSAKTASTPAPAPDVLFIDIEFQGEPRGIQATEQINRLAPNCQVVYLTNYLQYSLDVYHTSHAWYVLKSQFAQRLPEIFAKLSAVEDARRATLAVTTREGGIVSISTARILYLERRERSTFIHLPDTTHEVRQKIPDLLAELPQGAFSRCHYSFATNLAQVARIDAADLELNDGTSLPVSRRFAKRFREDYLRWAARWAV